MAGDGIEAIGQIAEGSLAARAVESGHGEGAETPTSNGHFAESQCLNCGSELTGAFCQSCGQKAHLHRSLAAFGHDLMHGVLHLDGKLWRTLPLLFFKPGEITRRYIAGERAKFVSPMAMFLFSVFMMFAVFQAVGLTTPTTLEAPAGLEEGVEGALADAKIQRDTAEEALANMAANDPDRPEAEAALKVANDTLVGISVVTDAVSDQPEESLEVNLTGIAWIDDGILNKWKSNPGLMLYKLQNNSYKFSWLLIPLSVPFVWLLFFWKRRYKAYDHSIFVTYSLAFMSLLFIILSVLSAAGITAAPILLAGILIPPVHIYKQLRGAYQLNRFSAFWRTAALTNMILFAVLLIFLWLLLLLGAL